MYVDHSALPTLNSFWIYPRCCPAHFVSSFQAHRFQFVLPVCSLVSGHLLEHGRPISGHSLKENCLSFSQHLWMAMSTDLCLPPLSMPEFCLAWACPGPVACCYDHCEFKCTITMPCLKSTSSLSSPSPTMTGSPFACLFTMIFEPWQEET